VSLAWVSRVGMVSLVGGVLLAGCGSGGTPDPIVPVQSPPEPPAPSSVLVWAVTGTLATGTLSGTFSYDRTTPAYATDAHGLAPNALYHLTAWDLTISPTELNAAPIHFVNDGSTVLDELCLGECILDPRLLIRLLLKTEQQSLQLVFEPPVAMQIPTTVVEWGLFEPRGSALRAIQADGTFASLIFVQGVTLTLVPTPL
jgi:hypothetical protein